MEKRLERIEKDKIRNNLIVTGIKIGDQREVQLKKTMQVMLERELGIKAEIKRASRINNQKCIIEMQEWRHKVEILTEKKKLKGGNVFIDPDLTKKEREVQKTIRERAREEREKGKRTKVGYKKMTVDGKEYRWDERQEGLVSNDDNVPKN